jgi:hypothetical protein
MITLSPDARPAVTLDDATEIRADGVLASAAPGTPLTPVQL